MKFLLSAIIFLTLAGTSAQAGVQCECEGQTDYGRWIRMVDVYGYNQREANRQCIRELDRYGKWNYITFVNHWLGNCRWY